MTETDVSFSDWKEIGSTNSLIPKHGAEDLQKKIRAQEVESKKNQALLQQKIEILESQLEEFKDREQNMTKMNETIMCALNDMSTNEDKEPRMNRTVRELEKVTEQHNREMQEYRSRTNHHIQTLESENKKLRENLSECELHNKELQLRLDKAAFETLQRCKQLESEKSDLESLVKKYEEAKRQGKELYDYELKLKLNEQKAGIERLKEDHRRELEHLSKEYDSSLKDLKVIYESERKLLESRLEKTSNLLRKNQNSSLSTVRGEDRGFIAEMQTVYEAEAEQINKTLANLKSEHSKEIEKLKKEKDQATERAESLEVALKKMKAQLKTAQDLQDQNSKILKDKIEKAKELSDRSENCIEENAKYKFENEELRERLKRMEASEKRLRSMLMSGKENIPHQSDLLEGRRRENRSLTRGILVEESQNMLLLMSKLKGQSNTDNSKATAESKKNVDSASKLCYFPPNSYAQQSRSKEKSSKVNNAEMHQNKDGISSFNKKSHPSASQDRRNSAQMASTTSMVANLASNTSKNVPRLSTSFLDTSAMGTDYETNHMMGARFSLKGNNISRIITQNYTPSKSIFESCQSFLKESTASAATERPKYGCYDYDEDYQKNKYCDTYNELQKHENNDDYDNHDGDGDFDGFTSEGEQQVINGAVFAAGKNNRNRINLYDNEEANNDEIPFEAFHTPDNYGNECDPMMGTSQFYQPLREVVDNNQFDGDEEEEMTTRFKNDKNSQVHNSIDSKGEDESKKQIQTTEKKLSRRNSDVVNIPINYDEFLKKTERSRLRSEGTETTLNSERCNFYNEPINNKLLSEVAQKTDGDEVRYHTSRLETSDVPKLDNVLLKHSRGVFGNEAVISETNEEEHQVQEKQPGPVYNSTLLYNTLRAGTVPQERVQKYEETQFSTQKKAGHFSNPIHENDRESHNEQGYDRIDKKYKNTINSRNTSLVIQKSPSLSSLLQEQKQLQQRDQSPSSSLKPQKGKQSQLPASSLAGESKIERHLQDLETRLFQMESMNNDLTVEKNKVKEEFQGLLSELQLAKQNTNLGSNALTELKNGEKEVALKTEIKFLIGKLLKVKTNLEKQSEEMMMNNSSGVQTIKQRSSQNLHQSLRRSSVQSEQDKYNSEVHSLQSNPLYMTCSSSPPLSGTHSNSSTLKKGIKNTSNNSSLLSGPLNNASNSTSNYNSNSSNKHTKSQERIEQNQQVVHENLLEKMKITKSSLGRAIENFSKNVRCRSNLRDNWTRENFNNNTSNTTKISNSHGRSQEETSIRTKTPMLARTDDGREVLLDFRKMRKNV